MTERPVSCKLLNCLGEKVIGSYKFTSKKQSVYGIMSTTFGVVSTVTFILCIFVSYKVAGDSVTRLGASALLAILYMIVGIVLAIISLFENDKFNLFKITGFVFFVTSLLCLSALLYAGAML